MIPHTRGLCTGRAASFIVGNKENPNPIVVPIRILPLHELNVGESIVVYFDGSRYPHDSRKLVNEINKNFGNIFQKVYWSNSMEIVRIK